MSRARATGLFALGAMTLGIAATPPPADAPSLIGAPAPDPERGAYLAAIGGCANCHTDTHQGGAPLAGGVALRTAFGTFYGTNITSDPDTGLGRWREEDFLQAMRHGIAPDGRRYWPAFPYAAYTRLTDADLRDLWAWLERQPPVAAPNRPHALSPLYRLTPARRIWRTLYFDPGPIQADPTRSPAWNRGAYLVRGPGHCGECHTPRSRLGGLKSGMELAGTDGGPGPSMPNITPDPETGIGEWSEEDLAYFLRTGILPEGDVVGGEMGRIVSEGTSRLTDDDLRAMTVYLRSVPPVRHRVGKRASGQDDPDEPSGDP